jgi:hypothetical protein
MEERGIERRGEVEADLPTVDGVTGVRETNTIANILVTETAAIMITIGVAQGVTVEVVKGGGTADGIVIEKTDRQENVQETDLSKDPEIDLEIVLGTDLGKGPAETVTGLEIGPGNDRGRDLETDTETALGRDLVNDRETYLEIGKTGIAKNIDLVGVTAQARWMGLEWTTMLVTTARYRAPRVQVLLQRQTMDLMGNPRNPENVAAAAAVGNEAEKVVRRSDVQEAEADLSVRRPCLEHNCIAGRILYVVNRFPDSE